MELHGQGSLAQSAALIQHKEGGRLGQALHACTSVEYGMCFGEAHMREPEKAPWRRWHLVVEIILGK